MKRNALGFALLIALGIFALAPAAVAGTINIGDKVKVTGWGIDGGGIITLSVEDSVNQYKFDYATFCIQKDVDIVSGTWCTVASISDSVYNHGTLSQEVDYLFAMFATGHTGYTGLSETKQNALQHVIWYFQGGQYNPTSWNSDEQFFLLDAIKNAGTEAWGTKVLNLVDENRTMVQNQLYYENVPEPSSLLLLGLGVGMLGLAILRK